MPQLSMRSHHDGILHGQRQLWRVIFVLLVVLVFAPVVPAQEQVRIALIVTNQNFSLRGTVKKLGQLVLAPAWRSGQGFWGLLHGISGQWAQLPWRLCLLGFAPRGQQIRRPRCG